MTHFRNEDECFFRDTLLRGATGNYFRAGEFSWSKATSINIASTTHGKKVLQEQISELLLYNLKVIF